MKNNVLKVLTKYLNTQELMSLKNEVKNEDLNKLFSYIIKEGNKAEYFKLNMDKDKILHIELPVDNIVKFFEYLESTKN
jgi:hypothetical protein